MSSIKIFAPVDGEIGKIEDLNDGVFSEKMLGDGFYIKPNKDQKDFYSPLEAATVSLITDTKHAYFFSIEKNVDVLMHIGLDTVQLNGGPFNQVVNIGDSINLKSKIVEVDLKAIGDANLDDVCPITINSQEVKCEFNMITKLKEVKKGDLIGEFIESVDQPNIAVGSSLVSSKDFFMKDNKYMAFAKTINELVGGKSNYEAVYNCMTRLRFKIRDKSIVNEEQIKKAALTRGLVWNGYELQVVVGQDVFKVKDAVVEINNQSTVNGEFNLKQNVRGVSRFKKFLGMFGGIMVQVLPVFIGAGMIQAIIGILQFSEIMPILQLNNFGEINNAAWYWVILFAAGKTSSLFLGISIAIAASRYFKLDVIIGGLLGLILSSPVLFADGGSMGIGGEWILFKFADVKPMGIEGFDPTTGMPIVVDQFKFQLYMQLDFLSKVRITFGGIKIFVIMGTIFIASKIDVFVKNRINPLFDLTIRPFSVIFTSTIMGLVILMPIWNIFEAIFGMLMLFVSEVPLGIGVGVYAALWQVCVLFGMHLALGMVSAMQQMANTASGQGGYSIMGFGGSVSVYAQLGALVAVVIVTKDKALSKSSASLIPIGILGITEPILYGVNLPKKNPLIAGVIAAFIAGCFAGTIGLTSRVATGIGIFEVLGFFQYPPLDPEGIHAGLTAIENGLFYILTCLIALAGGIIIGMLMYRERKTEKSALKSTTKLLIKQEINNYKMNAFQKGIDLKSKNEKEKMKSWIKNLEKKLELITQLIDKDEINKIKDIEKAIVEEIKWTSKLQSIEKKEEKLLEKLMAKGKRYVLSENIEKADNIKSQIQAINNEKLKEDLKIKIGNADKLVDRKWIDNFIKNKLEQVNQSLNKIDNISVDKNELMNNYENSLNDLRLAFKLNKPKKEINFANLIADKKYKLKSSLKAAKANK